MPSPVQAILLTAVTFMAWTTMSANASPLPMSLTHASHGHESSRAPVNISSSHPPTAAEAMKEDSSNTSHPANPSSHSHAAAAFKAHVSRQTDFSSLRTYYSNAKKSYGSFRDCASTNSNAYAIDQHCVVHVTNFNTYSQGFTDLLRNLAADKGLANYDRTSGLQTILKDYVDLNKDFYQYCLHLIDIIPGLDGILYPLLYNVKCLLDYLLNATENILDGLLNALSI